MAKFKAYVKQTLQFEIEIEREVDLDVLKKDIVYNEDGEGYCNAAEYGAPSAWYDYVEDYIRDNGGTINFTNEKSEDDISESLELPLQNLSHIENIGKVKSELVKERIIDIERK